MARERPTVQRRTLSTQRSTVDGALWNETHQGLAVRGFCGDDQWMENDDEWICGDFDDWEAFVRLVGDEVHRQFRAGATEVWMQENLPG